MRKMPQQGDSHKSFQFCRAAFFAFTWYSLSAKGFRIGLHDKKSVSKFIPILVIFCEERI